MMPESEQLDFFSRAELMEDSDEYLPGWTLDPVLLRLHRLRWARGIETVEVTQGYL